MTNLLESIQTKSAVREIAKGKVNFDASRAHIEKSTLYFRKAIGGLTGIQQLLKPADVEKDGVRNIDSARLPSGEAFLVTGIVFSTGHHGNPDYDLKDESNYSKLTYRLGANTMYAETLFNSELSLKVGNKEKFKSILRHAAIAESGDKSFENAAYEVTPFIIESQQNISPELNIFKEVALSGSEDMVLEVALVGYKISGNNA